jgi:hypothetical protein
MPSSPLMASTAPRRGEFLFGLLDFYIKCNPAGNGGIFLFPLLCVFKNMITFAVVNT